MRTGFTCFQQWKNSQYSAYIIKLNLFKSIALYNLLFFYWGLQLYCTNYGFLDANRFAVIYRLKRYYNYTYRVIYGYSAL